MKKLDEANINERKEKTAILLITSHYMHDHQMIKARYFISGDDNVIRLLELTEAVSSSECPTPFAFAPSRESKIDFPSSVILVNRKDWNKIAKGTLKLPAGWNFNEGIDIPKPA